MRGLVLQSADPEQGAAKPRSGGAAPLSGPVWFAAAVGGALAYYCWLHAQQFSEPNYWGDAGFRLFKGKQIVVETLGRTWLPWLQLHIYPFYRMQAPLSLYGVIPLAYMMLFASSLAVLWRRFSEGRAKDLVLCLLVLFSALSGPLGPHYSSLHQENTSLGLGYLLLCLYFCTTSRKAFIAVFCAAVLARENFWIYYGLFLCTLLPDRERRRAWLPGMLLPGACIAAWLIGTGQGILPRINRIGAISFFEAAKNVRDIAAIAWATGSLLLILFFASLLFFLSFQGATRSKRFTGLSGFLPFSLASLAIMYGYVVIFDPWQFTPRNVRILGPFYEQVPMLALVFFQALDRRRLPAAALLAVLLAASLLRPVQWDKLGRRASPETLERKRMIVAAIEARGRELGRRPLIVLRGMDFWWMMAHYTPVLLYRDVRVDPKKTQRPPDFIVAPEPLDEPGYRQFAVAGKGVWHVASD